MFNLLEGAEDLGDEALIRAIRRMNDPEEDPKRHEECSDEDDCCAPRQTSLVQEPVDRDMERMQNDIALRHHLKLGSKFTGPKGVKEDHDFHKKQERARQREKQLSDYQKRSNAALSSGWLQRTIAEESNKEEAEEEDDFMKQYRQKRIAELTRASQASQFGRVVELNINNYIRSIDGENPDVKVLIHLYDLNNEASRLVDTFFPSLAAIYRNTKFCRIAVHEADPDFDLIGLPAVLVYKGGHLEISLIRMIDEIPGWANSNRCTLRDFEEYLVLQDVLDDQFRLDDGGASVEEESDDSDFD